MKAHLTLDALSGGALVGAAVLMDEEEPEVRATLAAIGAWEIAAALLTRTRPYEGRAGKTAADVTRAGTIETGSWQQPSMPAAPARAPAATA